MKSPQDMRIIQIDITNACVYQCSNCTRFCGHHKKNFFMDYETFKRAVDSMDGYHGTIGVMGGEPTLHPEFDRFVRYLDSKLPKEGKKEHKSLIKPQKDFIESVLIENKINSEVYEYHTGQRETVVGAGLWSAMVPTYKKHYELIQDVFKMQAVNDHGNTMYHSPILISRKDMGIPDEEWIKIRDNCWAQDVWSATITPKGAFFCEIAGALDMLFDGPGGWPIEPGWWKRTPDQFGDQIKWCEYCGIAIETFTRDANDWIDDVSPSMFEKLKEIESPKMKKEGSINLVKIQNGEILEESKKRVKEVRKELFYDSFVSRFNDEKSILFPSGFDLIIDAQDWTEKEKQLVAGANQDIFNRVIVMDDGKWGAAFYHALRSCDESHQIIYTNAMVCFDGMLRNTFEHTVINPGTLHIEMDISKCDFVRPIGSKSGLAAMFNINAYSLRSIGLDTIVNAEGFNEIVSFWDSEKVTFFNSNVVEDSGNVRVHTGVRYAVYGGGRTGEAALRKILDVGSEVAFFVDSDERKWGTKIGTYDVLEPKTLVEKRQEYDQIIIASTYYKEIMDCLNKLGLGDESVAIFE